MKGNEKVITELNARLAEELTAINQYMVHAELCENWGYARLHKEIEKRAITEMKHAEKLIARILYLEGMPIVSELNKIHIGAEVEKQHQNDLNRQELQCDDSAGDRGRRQWDPRPAPEHSQRRRAASRLDRDATGPDPTDGHSELPERADRLRQGWVGLAHRASDGPSRVWRRGWVSSIGDRERMIGGNGTPTLILRTEVVVSALR